MKYAINNIHLSSPVEIEWQYDVGSKRPRKYAFFHHVSRKDKEVPEIIPIIQVIKYTNQKNQIPKAVHKILTI